MNDTEEQGERDLQIESTFEYCVIYIFGIDDGKHDGRLKIGETSIELSDDEADVIKPNDERLNAAAHHRIRQYTVTADIEYELLWTELGLGEEAEETGLRGRRTVHDHDVHRVLTNSGFKRKSFTTDKKTGEWFIVDLNVAKNAIAAAKRGDEVLSGYERVGEQAPLELRPEQSRAVKKTIERFKKKTGNNMLWDAKMRFGKTVSALTVAKEMGFAHTIIVTHRPVVEDGWYEDFNKIFLEQDSDWRFGGRDKNSLAHLQELEAKGECGHYVYFASLQDLRGSMIVGGSFDKDQNIFKNHWDYVVIDEAHEGTQTELAGEVLRRLRADDTKVLQLSGTPFNLYDEFGETDSLFTWDYTAEQKAKKEWDETHLGEPNPYRGLPEMRIYTYELSDYFREQYEQRYVDVEDKAFNFHEFFRVYSPDDYIQNKIPYDYPEDSHVPHGKGESPSVGDFVYEEDIWSFLNLITRHDAGDPENPATDPAANTCFPFSTNELRGFLRHTLWLVPGVKEARALSSLLQKHPVFCHYEVVNVAGAGDDLSTNEDPLEKVREAIGERPQDTYTITISCGKLTMGVTVPPWTGVLMLSNTSSPSTYLQTIFRVQSPADIDGKSKERCYAFDFAPDRTLKLIAEASRLRTQAGAIASEEQRSKTGDFLNFCPVISVNGSKMQKYDVDAMMRHLKRAAAQAAVRNGFDDESIYNENLYDLSDDDVELFNGLNGIIGKTGGQKKSKDLVVNAQGFDEEEYQAARQKKKKDLTPEERAAIDARNERNKQRRDAISILRGISIRIPMMIYGADVDVEQDITPDDLVDLVDDASWKEFMPGGVTKEEYKKFTRFYDSDVFVEAGNQIRRRALAADEDLPEERIPVIADIFAGFRNPDKETVLTPWRVVNMQLGDTLGGYVFYEEGYAEEGKLSGFLEDDEPAMRLTGKGDVTRQTTLNPDTTYLEINSKSGLYPLWCAYNSYAAKIAEHKKSHDFLSRSVKKGFWSMALENNIFVVCKTPMAKTITERTLRGFSTQSVNCICIEDPVQKIKDDRFEDELNRGFTRKAISGGKDDMKFDVIVGNPPYQENNPDEAQNRAAPIYQHFVDASKSLQPDYVSLVIPARWYTGTWNLGDFPETMRSDRRIRELHDFPESSDCFPSVEIKGGVCYFLWQADYQGDCTFVTHEGGKAVSTLKRPLLEKGEDVVIRSNEAISVMHKVKALGEESFSSIVSPQNPFGFNTAKRGKLDREDGLIPLIRVHREVEYIARWDVRSHTEWIDSYKVLIPKAGEGGALPNKILGKPFVAGPGTCCTGTYMVIGPFDDKVQAQNAITYIQTSLFRFLVSLKKLTQDTSDRTYSFVPLQDFTRPWTDQDLYEKYDISDEEVAYIERMITPLQLDSSYFEGIESDA